MIEVDGVEVAADGVALLPPVSVTVQRGAVLVVRGRNGSGKSTLLRVLAGARQPSRGVVRIDGEALAPRDHRFRRRVAAMIGLPPMAPDLTVFDHVLLVATTWLADPRAAAALARGVVAELGLTALGERFPHELSSGQTQLLGIALVLARPFEVLIVDEPEQRLDPEHVESGNIVFQSVDPSTAMAAKALRSTIAETTTVHPDVVVRTRAELHEIIDTNPFSGPDVDPLHLHVLFLPDHVPASLGGIDLPRFAPEQAVAIRREVFLHLPEGTGRSKLATTVHTHTKATGTQRNWRTVTALAALANQVNNAA